ncbi:MAG: hypothetical protein M1482_10710 [Chloroflexi bacterium]|nr:hypothetical protein [Chloroflexota bacterium]
MRVELLYDPDCPNVADARRNLLRAFAVVGQQPLWTEWSARDPLAPPYVARFGSPAVLVNGVDVAGGQRHAGASCRLYAGECGQGSRAPSAEVIASTLRTAGRRSWTTRLATAPGVGVALLPKLACPACWPAYAALLSSAGLGFLLSSRYLLGLTAAFLLVAVGAIGYRARQSRRFAPLITAFAVGIIAGKCALEAPALLYSGIAALAIASVWNACASPRRAIPCACSKEMSSENQKS